MQPMLEQRRKLRIGEIMVQQGLISQDQLRIALIEQEHNDLRSLSFLQSPDSPA